MLTAAGVLGWRVSVAADWRGRYADSQVLILSALLRWSDRVSCAVDTETEDGRVAAVATGRVNLGPHFRHSA